MIEAGKGAALRKLTTWAGAADDMQRYLARATLADEKIEKLALAPRVLGSFSIAPNRRIAAVVTSAKSPGISAW